MEDASAYSEVVAAYAQAAGARASWLVRADGAVEVMARAGMVGAHDRVVAYAGLLDAGTAERYQWRSVALVDELEPAEFARAGAGAQGGARERERLVPQGSPASYAHPAGMSSDRVFWLVPSMGERRLRIADLRAFAREAQRTGALLVVDNTVPTVFGCHPLALGAQVSVEALGAVAAGPLAEPAVAVSVARSLGRRGRRHVADPRSEDAFRLLSFGFGAPGEPACGSVPPAGDVELVGRALDELAARMQPRFDGANAIASYLACHPAVGSVSYPALATHPDHVLAPTVLEHGSGYVVEFSLTGAADEPMLVRHSHAAQAYRRARARSGDAPAAHPATRLVPVVDAKTSVLRLYMGSETPLAIVDSLDQALRLFCNPPEP